MFFIVLPVFLPIKWKFRYIFMYFTQQGCYFTSFLKFIFGGILHFPITTADFSNGQTGLRKKPQPCR